MAKSEFQQLVDHELSNVYWDERCKQQVYHELTGRKKIQMKKRTALIFAMVLLLTVSLALAAGIQYSQKYDAQKLAEKTLLNNYGITDEMLTFFSRQIVQEKDTIILTYRGMNDFDDLLGTYTIKIQNGKVDAEWNMKAVLYAWGSEKLQYAVEMCKKEGGYAQLVKEANQDRQSVGVKHSRAAQQTEEEIALLMEKQQRDAETAKALAQLEWAEIDHLARKAIQERYGLSDAQLSLLELVEESSWWKLQQDAPIAEPYYWLTQQEGEWTEGDGIYIVEVNAETGTIEGIVYDSGIAGNG